MKEYISIDIGGTAIKYGVVREDGTILCRSEMATEAYKGGPAILEKALGLWKSWRGHIGSAESVFLQPGW